MDQALNNVGLGFGVPIRESTTSSPIPDFPFPKEVRIQFPHSFTHGLLINDQMMPAVQPPRICGAMNRSRTGSFTPRTTIATLLHVSIW